jgi:RNA polymerase sigma-70 factor, ECF subfamily
MTGSAADADDVVQETFIRALARPPGRLDLPLRPWLAKVAINLARDVLRRRRARAYVGPWLPTPVELPEVVSAEAPSPEARYDLAESASFAFLRALEVLTPRERAVLVLRDVFDYSVRETADALDTSQAAIKTAHHRARRALADYDRSRCPPTLEHALRTERALRALLGALTSGDKRAVEALLSRDARAVSDGGGEFLAALKPIRGASKVARFFSALSVRAGQSRVVWRSLNALPAVVIEIEKPKPRTASRVVLIADVDAGGAIREIDVVLSTAKLAALAAPRLAPSPGS